MAARRSADAGGADDPFTKHPTFESLDSKITQTRQLTKAAKASLTELSALMERQELATAEFAKKLAKLQPQEQNPTVSAALAKLARELELVGRLGESGGLRGCASSLDALGSSAAEANGRLKAWDGAMKERKRAQKELANSKGSFGTAGQTRALSAAHDKVQNSNKALDETAQHFENERSKVLQSALSDAVYRNIEYHAKALELWSGMYAPCNGIVAGDMMEYLAPTRGGDEFKAQRRGEAAVSAPVPVTTAVAEAEDSSDSDS